MIDRGSILTRTRENEKKNRSKGNDDASKRNVTSPQSPLAQLYYEACLSLSRIEPPCHGLCHVRSVFRSCRLGKLPRLGRFEGKSYAVTTDRTIHTIIRIAKSRQMIATASAAIHCVSNKRQQLVSIRPATVAGLEQILADDRIKIAILMKIHDRLDFSGDGFLSVAFSTDELRLLKECRTIFQSLSMKHVDLATTIRLALLRHARPEFTAADDENPMR